MNRTSDAIVADYALARSLYQSIGRDSDLDTMNRLKAAADLLWGDHPGYDLDLAADNYIATVTK